MFTGIIEEVGEVRRVLSGGTAGEIAIREYSDGGKPPVRCFGNQRSGNLETGIPVNEYSGVGQAQIRRYGNQESGCRKSLLRAFGKPAARSSSLGHSLKDLSSPYTSRIDL